MRELHLWLKFQTMILVTLLVAAAMPLAASDLVITGAIDGPLTGGVPKAIEFYALNNIPDLSIYGFGSANNGGGTDGQEFTFPAVSVTAGTFLYLASETTGFSSFLGFSPDFTSNAASINGDDALELFQNGFVVDVFGDISVDGSGQPWEHLDGWAYRNDNTGPDCNTFVLANWSFSGPNALDGETTNGTAATPFPIRTFSTVFTDSGPCVQSTSPANGATGVAVDTNVVITFSEDVTEIGSWFGISCSSSGAHTATVSGGPQSFTLNPDVDFDASENCTVTILASQIFDDDADDPPDNIPADFVFSFATQSPAGGWVINEIHADPASGSDGDANGDGVRDSGDDEFVEIVNNTGSPVDISGWTLSDAFGLRHAFPAGSVVADGCGVVVFGGGTPTGSFGNMLVQTASGGFLGLNNGGDTATLNDGSSDVATAAYGSEGGDNQSLTLSPDVTGTPPYVKHTLATGSGGTRFSPGTWADGVAFTGCPATAPAWVINELHADPASGSAGDANGDGVRSSSADEFVEIVNNTGSTHDISGWTLSDASGLRHTFPTGSVVAPGCGVLVFGGGSPTGTLGRMPVQTASVGFLGLNNSGDTLTLDSGIGATAVANYGSEGGDNQSLTLDPDLTGSLPFVKHSLATNSGGALYSPGTKIDGSQFEGCPQELEIFEIQGSDLVSPFEGQGVITQDNVVTALSPDGFFMQTPSEWSDGDVDTSDGIFVFTGGTPAVSVGDAVDVTGAVQEFFGMTEISGSPVVTVDSSGNILPPAVSFDAFVPSPDPTAPSCAIEYECYEGMLVEIFTGTVAASNQEFGSDPFAEIHVVARSGRAFREPGIEFPGIVGLPVWDGNPEVFELDPDKLGLDNQMIPAGSTFSATGVIGFEFNHYELWPSELTVNSAPLPVPVRPAEPNELTVGSLNLFRLFAGDTRALNKLSSYIHEVLRSPDILAVQEVESLTVLEDLANQVFDDTAGFVDYTAYLDEGNDIGGIDVGFLVRRGITVSQVTQLGADELFYFDDPASLLHDRPPLVLEAICDDTFPIKVMVLHMRSLGGIETERTQQKRFEQAESVALMVQDIQDADPDVHLAVVGDFNAFEFTDGYVDLAGIIKGDFTPEDSLVCEFNTCTDLVDPDLTDEVLLIPAAERYSFIFRDKFNSAGSRGDAQVLDHAMTSGGLGDLVQDLEYGRGNVDAAEELLEDDGTLAPLSLRSSDHDGLVLYLFKDEDHDGVPDAEDFCLGTMIPEGVPTKSLGVNRWALVDEDGIFDTKAPNGKGPKRSFTIEDTAGCSCEQIIDELHLGKGHEKFGCSIGAMENWVAEVQD